MKSLQVGLALGGGGARGLAHIGVLQVLEENNISIHHIAGTSIGALAGAVYALNPNANQLKQKALDYLASQEFSEWRDRLTHFYPKKNAEKLLDKFTNYAKQIFLAGKAITSNSLFEEGVLEGVIDNLIENTTIDKCRLPFAAITVDIISGDSVILSKGSIRKAIVASASIPGVFPPANIDGRALIDGGSVSMVPVREIRQFGAQFVIAVDVSREIKRSFPMNTGIEVVLRADDITNYWLQQSQLHLADIVISPNVGTFHWAEFLKAEEIIEEGKKAATAALNQIEEKLKYQRRKQFLKHWIPFYSGS